MENMFGFNSIPDNDSQRVEALRRYKIIGTPPEKGFDNLARLAAGVFRTSSALISLVDTAEVYFKANIGMGNFQSAARGDNLCALAVLDSEVTVFEDASKDPALASNPDVTGDLHLRFYAGAPLITHDGFHIGTLCIIDQVPRKFTTADRDVLKNLAMVVMDEIELRLSIIKEVDRRQDHIQETTAGYAQLRKKIEISIPASPVSLASAEEPEKFKPAAQPLTAVGILTGKNLIIESANEKILELWGRTADVISKPLHLVMPELAGQPYIQILTDVLETRKPFYGNEEKIALVRNGTLEDCYFNFVYQPIKYFNDSAGSIMVVATEVTAEVLKRGKAAY